MATDVERSAALIRYFRLIEMFKKSQQRWGNQCRWLEKTFEAVSDLEEEVIKEFEQLWLSELPAEANAHFRAIVSKMDQIRYAALPALFDEVEKKSIHAHNMATRGKGAIRRHEADPKSRAMKEIQSEWQRAGRPGASFARDIAKKYHLAGIELTEGGIKNAISRWRKESSS